MAENMLTGGVASPAYPTFQPMQQVNPLAQIQAATQTAQGLQNLQASQVGLQHKKLEIIHNEMGALTSIPGGPSWQDVQDRITSMTQMGVLSPQEAASALPNIPQGNKPEDNLARKAFFDKQLQITGGYTGNMGAAYGAPGTQHVGDYIVPGTTNVRGGGFSPAGAPLQMGATPESKLAPQVVTDAAGNPIQTTAAGAATAKGFSSRTGNPLEGSFTTQGGAPKGIAAPPATFGPSLDAYNTDMRASSDLAKTIRTSSQALQLADALGTTGTGPGTKPFNDAKAFLESVGIKAPDDAVSMRNELDKYLQQTVNNSPLAQRSDMGTLATKLGTPNTTEQTNAATRALLRTGIAQAGMDAAVPHAYDWHGNNGSVAGYIQHKGSFTQNQDQQAYALAQGLMKPDEARAVLDKMNALPNGSAQKQKFFTSLANAKKAGLVNLPNASGQ